MKKVKANIFKDIEGIYSDLLHFQTNGMAHCILGLFSFLGI
jgi:hypothetical protein